MALFSGKEIRDLRRQLGPDPLGVLGSCLVALEQAEQVRIDGTALDAFAGRSIETGVEVPKWDESLHFRDHGPAGDERTAGWIFVLDTLNFCFWGQGNNPDDPDRRWRVSWNGAIHNGYDALAASLRKAADAGVPIWDPVWLANVDQRSVSDLLAPIPGADEIPLIEARVAHLRELGQGMMAMADRGDRTPFSTFIARSGGSAVTLVRAIVTAFPSFNDVSTWTSPSAFGVRHEIRFYKRAQILVSDLAGSLRDTPLGAFHDRHQLTAFADYKVPQVLRRLGVLHYRADLADRIRRRELIPAGSAAEIEIRAATIWACELIRQSLATGGRIMTASEVDWLLWNAGQDLPADAEPYHRTITRFY